MWMSSAHPPGRSQTRTRGWWPWTGSASVSERVVLLEAFTVEQNLALPFSLEVDQLPSNVRSKVRELADEVGISPDQLPQSVARLDADAQLRVRLGKALALGPRVLLAEHPNAALSPDEVPRFAADLAGIAATRHLAMVVHDGGRDIRPRSVGPRPDADSGHAGS